MSISLISSFPQTLQRNGKSLSVIFFMQRGHNGRKEDSLPQQTQSSPPRIKHSARRKRFKIERKKENIRLFIVKK